MVLAEAESPHHGKLVSLLVHVRHHQRIDDDGAQEEHYQDLHHVDAVEHLLENSVGHQVELGWGGHSEFCLVWTPV